MCYGKSSYDLRLLPNPLSSQVAAYSLEVVAYYSSCSSSHSPGYSDYSGYLSNPSLDSDSDSGTCSDMYYLQTVLFVVDSTDSHIVLTLLSSARLTIHSTVLSSIRLADILRVILNCIQCTLLLL